MKIRCTIDGLELPAVISPDKGGLVVYDGDESFVLEAVEAMFYELVAATQDELVQVQQGRYRLLRQADDFELREKISGPFSY